MNVIAATNLIRAYIKDLEKSNRSDGLMYHSYSVWAAREILRYVGARYDTPPLISLDDFIEKMDDWSCRNGKQSYMFSVAHDIAQDIYDYLTTQY